MKPFLSLLLCAWSCQAAIIYDNSKNDLLTRFWPGTLEVGNEIVITNSERWVTNLTFEYFCFTNNANVRLKLYKNDGDPFNGYPTPGTVLFDSGWWGPVPETTRATLIYSAGSDFPASGVFIGNSFTFTVQFDTEACGLDIYWPPTVGFTYGDYWLYDQSWFLKYDTNGVPITFAARIEAQKFTVPVKQKPGQPSTDQQ